MKPTGQALTREAILSITLGLALVGLAGFLPTGTVEAAPLTVLDDLVTHFDAAIGTYKDNGITPAAPGDLVQWWDDQATAVAGNNAAQQSFAKPTLQLNALNGRPVLHYSGGQNLLVLDAGAGGASSPMGAALDVNTTSWFMVARKDGPSSTDRLLGVKFGASDDRWGSFYQTGSYYSHSRDSGGVMKASSTAMPTDTFVIQSAVWDGNHANDTIEQWINGVSGGVATGANQTGTFDRLRIGASSANNTFLKGDVAEVLIYNKALSNPDRRSVEDYLHTKYFVSGPERVNDFPLANNLRLHATGDTRDINGSTVLDTAGIPQNGTIQGAVGNPAGILDQALSFNGSDSNYVNFGNTFDPGTDSFTVSLWFKPTDVAGTEFLAGKGNAASADLGWSVFLANNSLQIRGQQVGGGSNDRFGQHVDGVLTANQWHQVVMVLDRENNTIRGYYDGSNDGWLPGGSGAITDSLLAGSSITAASNLLYLGRRATTGAPYNGQIDDFAIWDRALSVSEIEYLYAKGLEGFNAATVPEPSTWTLMGLGLVGLAALRRRTGKHSR